mgnify:CR=1 FL=1
MEYGAKHIRWAPIAAEPAKVLPTYGPAVTLGELNQVADNPSYVEAKAAGDNNATARHVKKFQQATVDVTVLDILNEVATNIFGAKIDETPAKDLHFNISDKPPYGGAAFYTENLMAGNQVKYQGIFYPKMKAAMQGKTYDTTGDSITLANSKVQFTAIACNNGDWKVESPFFDTEAEAETWVDTKLPTAGSAG